MITEKALQEAIAECNGTRNPNANTCLKLAAYYTIKDHLYGDAPQYSYEDKSEDKVMAVFDELLQTLAIVNPKLYNATIEKLRK